MIGIRIAALRRDAGLSQAQLAQKLKISPSAMGMYEQRSSGFPPGQTGPSPGRSWRYFLLHCFWTGLDDSPSDRV